MPELPEVEAFKNIFKHALQKKIVNVLCKTPSLLKKASPKQLASLIIGKSFSSVERKGKFLIANIASSECKIVMHFGMAGSLEYRKQDDLSEDDKKYGHVIFLLSNGYALIWLDKRKFGRVYIVHDINEIKTLKEMAPDSMSMKEKDFLSLLEAKERTIVKTALMDQRTIAGIGNEYSNEILFQAGIDPNRKISSLKTPERKKLYRAMLKVLKHAVKLGGVKKLPSSWLLYHLKTMRDMSCPKNKNHALKRKTIGGRSAFYCPIDQR